MTAQHRLLDRQLRRLGVKETPDADQWAALLAIVSRTYAEADDERYILERSVDVSSREMRGLHDELRRQAGEDALTGLPNRAVLVDRLAFVLAGARTGGPGVTVLFIDLDGFKAVNDALGHAAGDELLIRVGQRIRGCLRPSDVLARLGGDEFVVVCADGAGRRQAMALAQRICDAVAGRLSLDAGPASVTASVGVARAPTGRESAEQVLQRADAAMYRVKAQGKAGIACEETGENG